MAGRFTLSMIKPRAVAEGYTAEILNIITKQGGFRIAALKMIRLSREQAMKFYEVHKQRPFYNELVDFMSSGPIVVFVLEKENAVEAFRNFIGATDPSKAQQGTIRAKFGKSIQENCVHGSDSDENAKREIKFFFASHHIFDANGNILEL